MARIQFQNSTESKWKNRMQIDKLTALYCGLPTIIINSAFGNWTFNSVISEWRKVTKSNEMTDEKITTCTKAQFSTLYGNRLDLQR